MVLSCAVENSYEPIRFAGTWKQYSKKAMPQLARMTFHSASLRYLRWPYQAKVIKIFETVSRTIVSTGDVSAMGWDFVQTQFSGNRLRKQLIYYDATPAKLPAGSIGLKGAMKVSTHRFQVRLLATPQCVSVDESGSSSLEEF